MLVNSKCPRRRSKKLGHNTASDRDRICRRASIEVDSASPVRGKASIWSYARRIIHFERQLHIDCPARKPQKISFFSFSIKRVGQFALNALNHIINHDVALEVPVASSSGGVEIQADRLLTHTIAIDQDSFTIAEPPKQIFAVNRIFCLRSGLFLSHL